MKAISQGSYRLPDYKADPIRFCGHIIFFLGIIFSLPCLIGYLTAGALGGLGVGVAIALGIVAYFYGFKKGSPRGEGITTEVKAAFDAIQGEWQVPEPEPYDYEGLQVEVEAMEGYLQVLEMHREHEEANKDTSPEWLITVKSWMPLTLLNAVSFLLAWEVLGFTAAVFITLTTALIGIGANVGYIYGLDVGIEKAQDKLAKNAEWQI